MAWWTNKDVHIKQKDKFIVSFGTYLIPTIVSCDKPKVVIEKKEYTMINQVYRYPGIAKWQPITIKFIDGSANTEKTTVLFETGFGPGGASSVGLEDPVFELFDSFNLDTAQLLNNILDGSGYAPPRAGRDGSTEKASMMDKSFGIIEPRDGIVPKGSIKIQQLEPNGRIVSEGWELHNPIITEISWGSLDYGSSDAVEYSMTIEYDWATLFAGQGKIAGNYQLDKTLKHNSKYNKNLRTVPLEADPDLED